MERDMYKFSTSLLISLVMSHMAIGDTMILNNGEKLTVDVIEFDGTTYKVLHHFSKSIKYEKKIPASEVRRIRKDAPKDIKAFEELQKILPVADGKSIAFYDRLLTKEVEVFLEQFPQSKFSREVKEIKATLIAERDKIQEGYLKKDGEFISPDEQARHSYNMNANAYKTQILLLLKKNKIIPALRQYELLRNGFQHSGAFNSVLGTVKETLIKYNSTLEDKIKKPDKAPTEKFLKSLSQNEAKRIYAAYKSKRKRIEKTLEEEKNLKSKWKTVDPERIQSLLWTKKSVDRALYDIEKIRSNPVQDGGHIYTSLFDAITNEDLDSAEKLLKDFSNLDPTDEFIAIIEEKFFAMKRKVEKEQKLAEEAKKASEEQTEATEEETEDK